MTYLLLVITISHGAAADCRFERMHHERDYPGMFLDHSGYQKTLLVKSEMHVLGQEAHQVPQGCPMGPKFLVQKISNTTLKWYVFMGFFDLLAENQSLFSDSAT